MDQVLEEMGVFFDNRIETYEDHMLTVIGGMQEAYQEIAKYIPIKEELNLVDLGCGTGLELEELFKINPSMHVVCIDLSSEMLRVCKEKYRDRNINCFQMSYFNYDFGFERFDFAVSSETLHHFSKEDKLVLYKKLCQGIVNGGIYIECDYMAPNQEYEDFYFAENKRIRQEHGISEGFYHYDTPCTIENQIILLKEAGFRNVERVWQYENTVILIAYK